MCRTAMIITKVSIAGATTVEVAIKIRPGRRVDSSTKSGGAPAAAAAAVASSNGNGRHLKTNSKI